MQASVGTWPSHLPAVCLDIPNWYALTTAPQREFGVDLLLSIHGVTAEDRYVPYYTEPREKRRSDNGKMRQIDPLRRPLFPGYVFARFPYADYSRILDLAHITGIVQWNAGNPEVVPDSVVKYMKALVAAGARPAPSVQHWQHGDRIRATRGPWTGQSGVVVEDGKKFILEIEIFGGKRYVQLCNVPADAFERV